MASSPYVNAPTNFNMEVDVDSIDTKTERGVGEKGNRPVTQLFVHVLSRTLTRPDKLPAEPFAEGSKRLVKYQLWVQLFTEQLADMALPLSLITVVALLGISNSLQTGLYCNELMYLAGHHTLLVTNQTQMVMVT
ncbi:unnamed protein product [Fusarium graminearum]|uniref:Chromosome 4, complete genome n=1 Tax=Gibberella zeae (strain ATCC MYA-4620 / CBS 123657 / FGSC 9075 / NRRL 31084 / PH-1) TaxID=229533 RepID=I1RQY5_GIBZE|nr:hypothetical protein FGSG_06487 [Fusarium graminearum PH-1]ESU12587.1 hypothetical protein FGSG_06487 [Fusarium graminearum PH-1]EYB24582.1 hypothetical protein FG05_06487 [Fusarium graminearum]CEF82781.1 unnamed protein product [Fusarium graminearum]CZS72123.1 unnamed protein product [Fusarium graminearum]|eukprot:XP_011326094.1 hypothetical protein FGSG_06487 [Fusarium graminearum PH-1]